MRRMAERKAGQLLAKIDMPKEGGRPSKNSSADTSGLLEGLGISYDQSSQWQKLGAIPQKEFDLAIGESIKPPRPRMVIVTRRHYYAL
jgi:hypothetical protein